MTRFWLTAGHLYGGDPIRLYGLQEESSGFALERVESQGLLSSEEVVAITVSAHSMIYMQQQNCLMRWSHLSEQSSITKQSMAVFV
jgi:hypothetical protein